MPINPQQERRSVAILASLYCLRMLGLFMVLPVMALYGSEYAGATPLLIGVAIGAYGASQALLQLPLGMLSDRIGRKRIVIGGLLLLVVGSVIAATADNIYGLIIGRILQGSGAISATLMALVSDLTTEQNRTKSMAAIGASIGLAFAVSMVLGPILAHFGGFSFIFWFTALLAVAGIALVVWLLPAVPKATHNRDVLPSWAAIKQSLADSELRRFNGGIFTLHLVLTAAFVAVPGILETQLDLDRPHHWWVYLPVLGGSFIAMVPFMVIAEKRRRLKQVFTAAVGVLGFSLVLMSALGQINALFIASIFLFFFAFNMLEAQLPSLVSKRAAAGNRGTAMGIYSTSQFLGSFLGGVGAGVVMQFASAFWLFVLLAIIVAVWFIWARSMAEPDYLTNLAIKIKPECWADAGDLSKLAGVRQLYLDQDSQTAYIKVDQQVLDPVDLERWRAV